MPKSVGAQIPIEGEWVKFVRKEVDTQKRQKLNHSEIAVKL